ncbi:MAG: diaminopimelate decarboxylase family protein [Candidatus Methanospirareceae archaeon]
MSASQSAHRTFRDVDIVALAREYGTPLYVLSESIIESNYEHYRAALAAVCDDYLICYAVKANTTFAIIKLLGERGAGADVASEYELQIALDAGIPPAKIRANGNCKSDQYLTACIQQGLVINVDPEVELAVIDALARELGTEAKVNVRLAGFPLASITAPAITTSSAWSKFGIPIQRAHAVFQQVAALKHLVPNGLMVHLGSQITDITAYQRVCETLVSLARAANGLGFAVNELNLGGGCGISYLGRDEWAAMKRAIADPETVTTWANEQLGYNCAGDWVSEELYCPFTPDRFIQQLFCEHLTGGTTFKEHLEELGSPRVVIEPGRSIVGNAQVTVVQVGHVGTTPIGHNIVHVNAGVQLHSQNLIVPEQLHHVEIAGAIPEASEQFETFIAGNLCFTGDLLYRIKYPLQGKPKRGDYLIIFDTGAYADFFAANTNSFPRPAKVLISNSGAARLVVQREDVHGVFQRDLDWSAHAGDRFKSQRFVER